MKVRVELGWHEIPMRGYTFYWMDINKDKKSYCVWFLYPVFALKNWFYYRKLNFYHFLNDAGIMHTPHYCVMKLSDIWRR